MPIATDELELRRIPESVSLTREQYLDLLGALHGLDEVFTEFTGGCSPAPAASAAIDDAYRTLDRLSGDIGPDDEQMDQDPVLVEVYARGHDYAAKVFREMRGAEGFGLEGVLPELYAPSELRNTLLRWQLKHTDMAKGIREQGRI